MPDTRVLVAPGLKDELERDNLLDLDSLFAREDKQVVKARLDSRQTYRLRTSAGRVLYLKLYREVEPPTWRDACPALCRPLASGMSCGDSTNSAYRRCAPPRVSRTARVRRC